VTSLAAAARADRPAAHRRGGWRRWARRVRGQA